MAVDQQTNELLIGAGIGGGFGLLGSSAIALRDSMTFKQLIGTLIFGMGFGCSTSVGVLFYFQVNPILCIVSGWLSGLMCIGLSGAAIKIGAWINRRPWALIPRLKDMEKDEATKGETK